MASVAGAVGVLVGFAVGLWLGRNERKTKELVLRVNERIALEAMKREPKK